MKQSFLLEISGTDNDLLAQTSYFSSWIASALKKEIVRSFPEFPYPNVIVKPSQTVENQAISLLKRASDSLNDYRAERDGDYNDSLATEIDKYIRDIEKKE